MGEPAILPPPPDEQGDFHEMTAFGQAWGFMPQFKRLAIIRCMNKTGAAQVIFEETGQEDPEQDPGMGEERDLLDVEGEILDEIKAAEHARLKGLFFANWKKNPGRLIKAPPPAEPWPGGEPPTTGR